MNHERAEPVPDDFGGTAFATTQWSMVLAAGHDSAPDARAALEQLCRAYWYPLYAFLRRSGHSATDAEDLIQGFFERLIEHDWLTTADPAKGRFRSFLLICLKRYVGGETRMARAQKRGGRSVTVSLDEADAAQRYEAEDAVGRAPDEVYDRRWALTLLEQSWDRLQGECKATGKLSLFEHLRAVQEDEGQSQEQLAAALGMTESALKSALFRLRSRYREILRHEVAQTVSDPGQIDGEIRYLLKAVSA
ncbi:MAG: sigma-70 family RNA polymerase sigma factor [Verrucomicrobiales bacterium]|nr:sigma-70 family RNA polymerase sigma factor [Verrucomicrobiales bacterium]